MFKTLSTVVVATFFFAGMALAAGPSNGQLPKVKIDPSKVKLDGDCTVEARVMNSRRLLKYSYQLPDDAIGFGVATCKDGSSAYFILHEKLLSKKRRGRHAANLTGYFDGTAANVYGTYGFFKKISIISPFLLRPIPIGFGVLAAMKSQTSPPLVLIGLAFGVEISEHIGLLTFKQESRARVLKLFENWEGKFDGKSPFEENNG